MKKKKQRSDEIQEWREGEKWQRSKQNVLRFIRVIIVRGNKFFQNAISNGDIID